MQDPATMSHNDTWDAMTNHTPHDGCPATACAWLKAVVRRQIDTDPAYADDEYEGRKIDDRGVTQRANNGLHRPDAGAKAGNAYGTFTVKASTDPQARYLRHLFATRNVTGATELQSTTLRRAQEQLGRDAVNKRTASATIDILKSMPLRSDAPADVATDGQVGFFLSLVRDRVTGLDDVTEAAFRMLTRKEASAVIDVLKARPWKPREPKPVAEELTAGIYLHDGKIYKVQKAVHGSGNLYAKELVVRTQGEKGTFEYARGVIRELKPGERMTLDQAKEYGAVYGVCCNCGRTLTDENSIEAGIGPVCARRFA